MNFTKDDIIAALKTVFDPEIPVNIWDLGLVYDIDVGDSVLIKMTLTSPTCPMAEEIVRMAKQAAESVAGIGNARVELVWDPPWSYARLSAQARLELDLTEEGW
ncbi:MAG: iron-sulfur cluster assembly protein [Alphaproteobacteria bacterium]|nr:iron-sulfur cluster assembly protein [Alphaproteobacteria bacterium]